MANLGSMLGLSNPKLSQIDSLMHDVSGGDPSQFQAQTDMLRGAREGTADPRLGAVLGSNEDQALADRYAWGASMARDPNNVAGPLALLPAMAYEGVKAVAPNWLMKGIGAVLPQGEEMAVDDKTSKPSLANIGALIAGYRSQR